MDTPTSDMDSIRHRFAQVVAAIAKDLDRSTREVRLACLTLGRYVLEHDLDHDDCDCLASAIFPRPCTCPHHHCAMTPGCQVIDRDESLAHVIPFTPPAYTEGHDA